MTSAAMVSGMAPMALGFNDEVRQMAPLGCAVVGGLVMATISTLFVLPSVYALVQKTSSQSLISLQPHEGQGPMPES
jgi:multidrug efflux pump subunit AcrB